MAKRNGGEVGDGGRTGRERSLFFEPWEDECVRRVHFRVRLAAGEVTQCRQMWAQKFHLDVWSPHGRDCGLVGSLSHSLTGEVVTHFYFSEMRGEDVPGALG
jgi:hypothetical protein